MTCISILNFRKTFGISDGDLADIAEELGNHENVAKLGRSLGFKQSKIDQFMATNRAEGKVTCKGTECMLFEWKMGVVGKQQHTKLRKALFKAGFCELGDQLTTE